MKKSDAEELMTGGGGRVGKFNMNKLDKDYYTRTGTQRGPVHVQGNVCEVEGWGPTGRGTSAV